MITLSANTKFSYNIARGTLSSRAKSTETMNELIFRRMLQLYDKKNSCGLGTIKNSYNALLPENKKVRIVPLPERDYDEFGGEVQIDDSSDCLNGYLIKIPVSKKNKLNILELSSFMHESTHVLDFLFNPKYIANIRKMYEYEIFDKDYFSLYSKYFYNTEPSAKSKKLTLIEAEEETRNKLNDISSKEKLVFLNYVKYQMEMEQHAYKQDLLYARILQKIGKPVDEISLEDYAKNMYFSEKINIVNRLIKEEIMRSKIYN